ncbi:cell division suppressor protein YneA [Scopulibacillus cellulosilyticus]|uniref:LysM peptidoglycan-binding domain-containing protein n=1 Tax=Scopulibacillus cellulosilyticus TaxID=2665665 RepID=A0ABW2Q186_9BACL
MTGTSYRSKSRIGFSFVIIFIFLLMCASVAVASDLKPVNKHQYKMVTVKEGDTIWSIANLYKKDTSMDYDGFAGWVERVNQIERNHIEPGQKLVIPVKK